MIESNSSLTESHIDWRLRFDLAIRAVLALLFALFAGFYVQMVSRELRQAPSVDARMLVQSFAVLAFALYMFIIACAYVLRLKPVNKFAGLWPSVAAILGGFMMLGMACFHPRTDLMLPVQLAGGMLTFIGECGCAFVLLRLGRSFSILPEGRRLVTEGPYRIVRHPLYLAEAVANLGVLITFLSMGVFLLIAAQFALQLVRMHYEERVLTETFPEYADYARRTARLIPGIY